MNKNKKVAPKIELITGPMFAGKTTELLRRLKRHELALQKCLLIKWKQDNREPLSIVNTHDGIKRLATSTEKLMDIIELANSHDVIAIDEGQFFIDIVKFLDQCLVKIIIISALDGDYRLQPFPSISLIHSLADEKVFLSAICSDCHGLAAFTKRITSEVNDIVIGGHDKYKAVCKSCHPYWRKQIQ